MAEIKKSAEFAGREFGLSTGALAGQASGAVLARYGETVVLATAVVAKEAREGVDYLPLMVDYEEKFYAAGKISGSRFIKREGRPSEAAALNSRLIDRPLRPLFQKGFRRDVQVILTVLSIDNIHDPAIVGGIAASSALAISGAPFEGPIGFVRIGRIDGHLVANPSKEKLEASSLDLVVAGKKARVLMIEAESQELSETEMTEAIALALKELEPIMALQEEFIRAVEKVESEASESEDRKIHLDIEKIVTASQLEAAVKEVEEAEREKALAGFESQVLSELEGNYKQIDLKSAFGQMVEKKVRDLILKEGFRPDGRKMDEIRSLEAKVGVLPRVHGSGLFNRGQTQALTIVTLGSPGEEQFLDTMEGESRKRYMHHYNFPPFSTGEVKPIRSTGRREIGHGALAEKALIPVLPSSEEFPYTIRVVSEILTSNGSSSMAATCGSTLALMDAGVPIKRPVGGIAIGLVTKPDFDDDLDLKPDSYKLLTDIQGLEDFGGDMDFKVAGTEEGITAIQLDMKLKGLPIEIVEEALLKAKTARSQVLETIKSAIERPRTELSKYAPRIAGLKIPVEKIGELIGPGGRTINGIIDQFGGKEVLTINIDDDGQVSIASRDSGLVEKALEMVKAIVDDLVVGQIYSGKVTEIKTDRMSGQEIGAIVGLAGKKEGMVHISEIKNFRVNKVSDFMKPGDEIQVKVLELGENGKNRLSYKAANPEEADQRPEGYQADSAGARPFRRDERR